MFSFKHPCVEVKNKNSCTAHFQHFLESLNPPFLFLNTFIFSLKLESLKFKVFIFNERIKIQLFKSNHCYFFSSFKIKLKIKSGISETLNFLTLIPIAIGIELNYASAKIFLPFSIASSIEPTKLNAASGY